MARPGRMARPARLARLALLALLAPASAGPPRTPGARDVILQWCLGAPMEARNAILGNLAQQGRLLRLSRNLTKVASSAGVTLTDAAAAAVETDFPNVVCGVIDDSDGKFRIGDVVKSRTVKKAVPYSWGRDRVDPPLDGNFDSALDGSGTAIYIVDAGMFLPHDEFAQVGRAASSIYDWDGRQSDSLHGTHCGGIAAGAFIGVAPKADVFSVRVLDADNSGRLSGVLGGLDAIVRHHAANGFKPAVVSISIFTLCGSAADCQGHALVSAVNSLVSDHDIVVAVSAGNAGSGDGACRQSPAAAKLALTVGATDFYDEVPWYSNFDKCVDIYAPGSGIYSADNEGAGSYSLQSGTSMSTPFVAGIAALYRQQQPLLSAAAISQLVIERADLGFIAVIPVIPEDTPTPTHALTFAPTSAPTPTPTHTPTLAPTPTPTPRPTARPSSDAPTFKIVTVPACADSTSWLKDGRAKKDCAWVSKKPADRCSHVDANGATAAADCAVSCGSCAASCTDVWAKKKRPSQDCAWVEKKPTKRCKMRDQDGVLAFACCDC
ncbi:peptidase S8/S53 domain-containing protein [Pelagophyceae sp. CCMP2097]|nr:peptidase S8/S53 domain-containing protein [Pelagophyceae sp. CCMP2097]